VYASGWTTITFNRRAGQGDSRAIPWTLREHRPISRPWLWTIVVAGVAFAFRLVPVMRGGGLYGLDSYDDGVY
jgi:hypothetical protein